MTRLNANQLGELAKAAKKAQRLATRRSITEQSKLDQRARLDQEQKIHLWKQLYLAAINGNRSATVQNLRQQDTRDLEQMGFIVTPKFVRIQKRNQYAKRLSALNEKVTVYGGKITELEIKMGDYLEAAGLVDSYPIRQWLYSNKYTAFQCSFEEWFGLNFDSIVPFSHKSLDRFKSVVERNITRSKDVGHVKALKKLIRAIRESRKVQSKYVNVGKVEERIAELGQKIKDYQEEISAIEQDPAFIYEDSVENTHHLNWQHNLDSADGVYISGYSLAELNWLSSDAGQETFKLLEGDITSLSKRGIRRVELRCLSFAPSLQLANNGGVFKGNFPSMFAFTESMRLLGYKVTGLTNGQIKDHCFVSW